MDFKCDPDKGISNKVKHGIDFEEAQQLWDDPDLLEVQARSLDEPRSLVIGRIEGRYWSGVITYRGSAVRIISVRRAREQEIMLYEST